MTVTTQPTPLSSYDLSDYEFGPPRQRGIAGGAEIDMQVAREETCSCCGHVGCYYRGFHKTDNHYGRVTSYRAFVVCPECGHAEEF